MSHFADDETLAHIAALETEVMQLRNALETFIAEHEECEDSDGWMVQVCSMEALHVADEALSTQFNPQALPELIEKVEKMTIERCATAVGLEDSYQDDGFKAKCKAVEQIRDLPTGQINLGELTCG